MSSSLQYVDKSDGRSEGLKTSRIFLKTFSEKLEIKKFFPLQLNPKIYCIFKSTETIANCLYKHDFCFYFYLISSYLFYFLGNGEGYICVTLDYQHKAVLVK